MSDTQWLMRIDGALQAHFKQPDGTSRPGADWAVELKNGEKVYKVFVRAYLSPDMTPQARADQEYQGHTVMGYVNDLLTHGWHPDKGGNLAITIQNPTNVSAPPKKPRWRFW